jgi:UDP-glucose 4-epimerase
MSPYAASKLASESYALAYQHSFDLPVLAFRFFNVFGPWQSAGHAYAAVIPAFVSAALAGSPLPVRGDGNQSRDFTSVDTVTSVICRAIDRRVTSPHAVNLAYGNRISLTTLIDLLSSILERPLTIDHQPARLGDVEHSQASNVHLTDLFPEVEPVDLANGLRKTVQWFREGIGK